MEKILLKLEEAVPRSSAEAASIIKDISRRKNSILNRQRRYSSGKSLILQLPVESRDNKQGMARMFFWLKLLRHGKVS